MSKLLTEEEVDDLFMFLAHGSEAHQRWLLSAIKAWNDGEPKPKPYE